MKIAVGLPSNIAGVSGERLVEWAARAEKAGFSSLVATDRFAWDQLDPVAALAAAAAVTSTIGLRLSVVLVPNRGSAAQLAKQLATVDALSGGRLVVGVGVGDREIDYRLAGSEHRGRHRRLEEMLDEMLAVWSGEADRAVIGPRPAGGALPLMMGGSGEPTWGRAAKYGAGWTMAVGGPPDFASGADAVRRAWAEHGRTEAPTLAAQRYFCLAEAGRSQAQAWLRDYFGFLGPGAEWVVRGAPLDADALRGTIDAFAAAGADELAFLPTSADPAELELLAAAALPAAAAAAGSR
ncbi:MAG TPA: LLM class flavin-dependent oxidoreductase [Solirubrobacteraceae bacterium]|nr:LLM class flavin-dependent oxidoreductase [Solirubrobacteraceae bacterium]